MSIVSLLNALPGAVAQGLIWGIMAIGVYITFRILDIADLMQSGHNVWVSLLVALIAGLLAGMVTGLLHTFMGIPAILAGILTQLGLYSVNLKIMGKSNQAINVDKFDLLISLRYIKNVCTGSLELSLDAPCVLPDVMTGCPAHRVSIQTLTGYLVL